jgi:uncharacterized repeat protein (TIGR01451 family)
MGKNVQEIASSFRQFCSILLQQGKWNRWFLKQCTSIHPFQQSIKPWYMSKAVAQLRWIVLLLMQSLVIQVNAQCSFDLSALVNAACFGEPNGSINLMVIGGTGGEAFLWSNGATTANTFGLFSGTYTVTVTDIIGCTETASASVPQVAKPVADAGIDNTLNCLVLSAVLGGNNTSQGPNITYFWSGPGITSSNFTQLNPQVLLAGQYFLTVTDVSSGCTDTDDVFVNLDMVEPSVDLGVDQYITCNNPDVDIHPVWNAPGGGAIAFQWSTPDGFLSFPSTHPDAVINSPGHYQLVITNLNNGCTDSDEVQVLLDVTPPVAYAGPDDGFPCGGGQVTLSGTGSSAGPEFGYLWTGNGIQSNAFTLNPIVDQPGVFTLTVTNVANGCTSTDQVNVFPGPAIPLGNFAVTHLPCSGGSIGAIDLSMDQGTAPYVFSWSNGSNTQDVSGLPAGTYSVTVEDATGCSYYAIVEVRQAISTVSVNASPFMPSCFEGNDGAIGISVFGGAPPYAYQWVGPNGFLATTEDINSLSPGNYGLTVSDLESCTATIVVNVANPAAISIPANGFQITTPTCFNFATGSIQISVSGGMPPYSFDWSNDGQETPDNDSEDLTGVPTGTYTVTITAANGCTFVSGAFVVPNALPLIATIEELSNNCNSAVIRANVTNGTPPYAYYWEGASTPLDTTAVITVPISSTYQVLVIDANGCGDFDLEDVELVNGGNCGYVQGRVRLDDNLNCVANVNEPGLPGWLVRAEGLDTLYGVTDASGRYLLPVPFGIYQVKALAPNGLWQLCANPFSANVDMPNDTAFGGNLSAQKLINCPKLNVTISTNGLRRCFSNNYYKIRYCNEGTAPAADAYVEIALDTHLTYVQSGIPGISLGNNTWRFDVGDLEIGECGEFYIQVKVECSAELNQSLCTEATIFPDTVCITNPLWSGATLQVQSICNNDSLKFIIQNVGQSNMTSVLDYIVVEDAVMFMRATLPQLNSGQSTPVTVPANGSTWYLEVAQETFHPNPNPVKIVVEGCTTNNSFSTGFANQFDINNTFGQSDIICETVVSSFDPNDKHSYPIGYGAEHDIRPGTEIDYLIRFQNTGTDTAFTVKIVDTLSLWLDPASVHFGTSSHPCRFNLTGEGIVQVVFEDILLPSSKVDVVGSHGFASFRVKPRPTAPLGSKIENNAAIYFDFNDPVITNTTVHRLGEDFIAVSTWAPSKPGVAIEVLPNPFNDQVLITLKGLERHEKIELQVFDSQGVLMQSIKSASPTIHLKNLEWPAGIYYYRLLQQGDLIGNGKLIVR